MFQIIDENIKVAGVYKHNYFIPKKFQWNEATYPVEKITLMADIRDGMIKKRQYSVLCNKTLYRLLFNRETETWTLEELWVD